METTGKDNYKDAQEDVSYLVDVKMDWGTWELPMEEYLVYALTEVMQDGYEEEALKAQAVLLRTELAELYFSEDDEQLLQEDGELLSQENRNEETMRIQVEDDVIGRFYYENDYEALEPYQDAVEKTKGLYLSYQGQPIRAAYFKVSNGHTRSAGEVWHTDEMPYLSGVDCEQDSASREWKSSVTVEKDTYLSLLRQTIGEDWPEESLWSAGSFRYDEAGYVTEIVYTDDDKTTNIDGEEFRYLFGMQSASFQVDWGEEQVHFNVTGAGHGFGMSQYAANVKALNGETYDQILKFFFKGTELSKFE